MIKVRVTLTVVLFGMLVTGLAFGEDKDPCYEAYLESGLTAQQMTFDEFRGMYGETLCATGGGVVHKHADPNKQAAAETAWGTHTKRATSDHELGKEER